jgi:DNA-binding PucR family transcriptional regulator
VEALRRHDAERGTEYVSTLAAWLDHPGEPVVAARTLHVHPNTLRYRMGRLAALPELQDVDLGDPLTRLALRLQLASYR